VDLIVSAFAKMPGKKLVVIGDGPEMKRIRQSASENISIMGYQPNQVVEDYLHRARALIFAAEEDFGITLVESQACGTPVIAYGKGGVLESVNEGETGFFYNEQSIDSLTNAIQAFEKHPPLDVQKMQRNAERFNKDRFKHEIETFVSDKVYEIFSSVSLEGKTEHDETK
jgi:glycosyltransferase involved in cell wall biosynthesis